MKIFDITNPISNQTIPWESEQNPEVKKINSIENGEPYNVTQINTSVHIGTHIDAPNHFINHGKTIDQIPLTKLIGKVFVIEIPASIDIINEKIINEIWTKTPKLNEFNKIIFKTKNSFDNFGKNKFDKTYTALDSSGAKALAEKNIHFIGIDYLSISIYDDMVDPHVVLLEKEIVILEGAQLDNINQGEYELYCLPINILGSDGAPVRAILLQQE